MRLSTGTSAKLTTTAATPATMASSPPSTAATTFCRAAMATTIGMYIALQNLMPSPEGPSTGSLNPPVLQATTSRSIAIPTPPTLASTPMATPRYSPTAMPMTRQAASSATP